MRLSLGGVLSIASFLVIGIFVLTGHGTTEVVVSSATQVAGASDITFVESGDTVIDAVNRSRFRYGIAPVYKSESLMNVAVKRTSDMTMNKYYAHEDSDGQNYGRLMVVKPNYSCENLNLTSESSIDDSISAWLASNSGHRECLLSPKVQFVGHSIVDFDGASDSFVTAMIFSN